MSAGMMHESQQATNSRGSKAQQNQQLDAVVAETARRTSLTEAAATMLGVSPAKLCNLLRNVWSTSKNEKPLTDQEMFSGISLIARYQLDPITREIFVSRNKQGRLMTTVSIDGWIKILDRTDHYDGFDVEIHQDESGKIDWVETSIYSTKRTHPARYRAFREEYEKLGGFVAGVIPTHMLRIFSLRHAARLFVPLGASVITEEEAQMMLRAEAPQPEYARADDPFGAFVEKLASADKSQDTGNEAEAETEPELKPQETGVDDSKQLDEPSDDILSALDAARDAFSQASHRSMAAITEVRDKYFPLHEDAAYRQEIESMADAARDKRRNRSKESGGRE